MNAYCFNVLTVQGLATESSFNKPKFKAMNRGITKPNLAIFLLRRSPFRSESEFAFKGSMPSQIDRHNRRSDGMSRNGIIWSSRSIQFSSQPASLILTSILCIVHLGYLTAIAHAVCFGKPNQFDASFHHDHCTCMALLV